MKRKGRGSLCPARDMMALFPLFGPISLIIWTVDLAYLLKRLSVAFSFFTVTLGGNPDFSSEAFYKEQLHDDLGRVNGLFEKALDAGIHIQHRSISGEEISFLILSGRYIAIALVDNYKLSYSWLKDVYVSEFYDGSSNYFGHFVVICGYDAERDEFDIRDPASSSCSDLFKQGRLRYQVSAVVFHLVASA